MNYTFFKIETATDRIYCKTTNQVGQWVWVHKATGKIRLTEPHVAKADKFIAHSPKVYAKPPQKAINAASEVL